MTTGVTRSTKLRALDLFCGAGGLSSGLMAAGYDVAFGLDLDVDACEAYALNHPGTVIECASITDFTPAEILKKAGGEIDLVAGGPSCQGFSSAGRRFDAEHGWARTGDERNELWKHQFEIVNHIKPRAFLLENVPGFMSFKQGTFGAFVLDQFRSIGYSVSCEILLAANYGIPQLRRRMFIVGLLGDTAFEFPSPTHLGGWRRDTLDKWEAERKRLRLRRHVTCWEAIADLPPLTLGDPHPTKYLRSATAEFAKQMRRTSSRLVDHELIPIGVDDLELIKYVPQGGTWRDIPPHLLPDRFRGMRRTDSTNLYGRLDPARPSYTIATQFNNVTTGCNTHPYEDRSLSVREAARLQSFADTYRFYGSTTAKGRQIGNAVPPRLAQVLGAAIADAVCEPEARRWVRRPKSVSAIAVLPLPTTNAASKRMTAQKRAATKPEVQIRKALHAAGIRYRVDDKPLPGLRRTADVVVRRDRTALFIDGCFWHGCPEHFRDTKSNTKWWAAKIEANRKRDAETTEVLEANGWLVVRVWEHEDPAVAAERVLKLIRDRREVGD